MFAGIPPAVWLSNQYSNTGVDFLRVDLDAAEIAALGLTATADPNNQPDVLGDAPTSDIAITDKDFKLPQVWRSNLAIDHQLPQGLVGTLEFMYAKNVNEVFFRNLNIGNFGAPVGTLPDGRPTYGGQRASANFNSVILMDNTSEGHQFYATVRLQKQPNRGDFLPNLFGSLAYTWGDAEDVNGGTSSRAISNWQFNNSTDHNAEIAATSLYEIKHRIVSDLSYQFNYAKGFGTTLSLYYEGRSGQPLSYVYDISNPTTNINGDRSTADNDLPFIPADRSQVSANVTDAEWTAIEAYINSSDALKDARGKILEANAARQPWQNRLDLRIAQQIPSLRSHKFEVTFDIINVLNLLNEDWGEVKFRTNSTQTLFNFSGFDAEGKADIDLDVTDTNGDGTITEDDVFSISDFSSRWQMQLGVRYSF